MRTIKFRALAVVNDKYNNIKVGDFVFGSYIENRIDAACIIFGDGEQIEIDKKTLGQFIGMKDVTGIDIYEGDIVDSDYYNPEQNSKTDVIFEQEDNSCRFGFNGGEQDAFRYGNLTVISNIHQNTD